MTSLITSFFGIQFHTGPEKTYGTQIQDLGDETERKGDHHLAFKGSVQQCKTKVTTGAFHVPNKNDLPQCKFQGK